MYTLCRGIVAYLFLIWLVSSDSSVLAFFCTTSMGGQKVFIYYPSKSIPPCDGGWHVFHESVFGVPRLLQEAADQKSIVVLIVPHAIDGITPVDESAPWIEGIRVAITWGGVYFRFNRVDVRILYYDEQNTSSEIDTALVALIQTTVDDNPQLSREQNMMRRVWVVDNLIKDGGGSESLALNPFVPTVDPISPYVCDPVLEELKPGAFRLLITGGAGFIGSNMVRTLIKQGHQIIIVDNLSAATYETVRDCVDNKQCVFFNHDVSLPFEVKGPLTHVVHLASLASPPFYYNKPHETLVSGLQGTKNTMEIALQKGARYLFSSTSEVYGDPDISPQPEQYPGRVSPLGMRSQYDQSKRGGETLVKLYMEKYSLDARIVRIFNTYGPHMSLHDGRVVTNFIRAILNHQPLPIYGNGLQTRSFAYVDDTVDGTLAILFADHISNFTSIQDRIFNIGTPYECTIVSLADTLVHIAQKYGFGETTMMYLPQPDPWDPKQRCPDITYAQETVRFCPQVAVNKGLEKTFLFFRNKGSDV